MLLEGPPCTGGACVPSRPQVPRSARFGCAAGIAAALHLWRPGPPTPTTGRCGPAFRICRVSDTHAPAHDLGRSGAGEGFPAAAEGRRALAPARGWATRTSRRASKPPLGGLAEGGSGPRPCGDWGALVWAVEEWLTWGRGRGVTVPDSHHLFMPTSPPLV